MWLAYRVEYILVRYLNQDQDQDLPSYRLALMYYYVTLLYACTLYSTLRTRYIRVKVEPRSLSTLPYHDHLKTLILRVSAVSRSYIYSTVQYTVRVLVVHYAYRLQSTRHFIVLLLLKVPVISTYSTKVKYLEYQSIPDPHLFPSLLS